MKDSRENPVLAQKVWVLYRLSDRIKSNKLCYIYINIYIYIYLCGCGCVSVGVRGGVRASIGLIKSYVCFQSFRVLMLMLSVI